MTYSYTPKDPRAKLREVVANYVQAMQVAGRRPNVAVVFDADNAPGVALQGYLVDDRRPQAEGRRYLLLADGDVIADVKDVWMEAPEDELITVLARSLSDARMGGSGWLADGGAAAETEPVPDRRRAQRPHTGPERRRA